MAAPQKTHWQFLVWLLAGAGAGALAWPFDTPVDAALDASKNPSLHEVAWWCSKLGEGWVPVAAGIPVVIIFAFLRRPRMVADTLFVVFTCSLTGLAVLIPKILFGRTRPLADVPQGFYGVWHAGHWIIGKAQFSSFPSGHSATAVGLAAAVWLVNRGWGAVAVVYALAVMWSRIALQCHHLTDVVASTFLSIPIALWAKRALYPACEFRATQYVLKQR